MPTNKQNIADAYNALYSNTNNGDIKTYEQLTPEEREETLLLLIADRSGGGGGGGTTNVDFGNPITGQTLETGGSGNLGWLSSVRKAITNISTTLSSIISNNRIVTTGLTDSELRNTPLSVNLNGASELALDETLTNGNQETRITDGVNNAALKNTTPSVSDYGLVVRNIPSGTQSVSVSNFPSNQTISGSVSVSNFPATQNVSIIDSEVEISNDDNNPIPVSAIALPLPTGAAQDRTGSTTPFATRLTDGTNFYKATTPSDTQPVSGTVAVNNFPSNQVVSGTVTSNIGTTNGLALNSTLTDGTTKARITDGTNSATVTNTTPNINDYGLVTRIVGEQDVSIVGSVNLGDIGNAATETTLTTLLTQTGFNNRIPSNLTVSSNRLLIDGSGVIQPVSGTITSNIGSTNGLALDANLTNGTQRTKITDGVNNVTVSNSVLTGTEYGIVARIIPSGTQTVNGTVAISNQITGYATDAAINTLLTQSSFLTRVPANLTVTNTRLLVDGSGVIQPVIGDVLSGATDTNSAPIKIGGVFRTTTPTYTNNQRGELRINSIGELLVASQDVRSSTTSITIADSSSSFTPGTNNQIIISNTPTAGSACVVLGSGNSSFAVQIDGTFVGTLQFERTLDAGVTWTAVGAFSAGTNDIGQTTTSLPGRFHGNASASDGIRVRATSWTSGTATVSVLLGQGTGTITVGNPLRLYDGVSKAQATIKPANTASTSTDTAIVTTLREGLMPSGIMYASIATNVSAVIKSSPGVIYAIFCLNTLNTTRYIQFFNSTTVPILGAIPDYVFSVFANGGNTLVGQDVIGGFGLNFSSGVTFGFSTTAATYTPGAAINCILHVRYI